MTYWPGVLKSYCTHCPGEMETVMTHTNGSWCAALSPARLCVEPRHSRSPLQHTSLTKSRTEPFGSDWSWSEHVFLFFFSPPSLFGKCWHFSKGLKTQTLNIFHWKTLGERERNNPQTANNQISFAFKAFGFMQGRHIWRSVNTFYENICSLKTKFFTRSVLTGIIFTGDGLDTLYI